MAVKHVVVDGSNIATEGRSVPSLAQLDEAVRAFLDERPHDALTVVVDATFEHRIEPSERRMYDDALTANELITPPAGTIGRGDKFLLEIAERAHATVFSNDSFQEFHGEYEWLFDEGRLVGGKPVTGVGWIFTERTPVRGPKSRMATRAAGKKRSRNAEAAPGPAKKAAARTSRRSSVALGPVPVPTAETPPPVAPSRRRSPRGTAPAPVEAERVEPAEAPDRQRRRRTGAGGPAEPVNRPLPFIEFIAEHPVGTLVEGEVVEFASHGAYVQVGDVRCYLPLKSMSDPPPRSAREVLDRGALRDFVVAALDAPRRGIDLALPGAVDLEPAEPAEPARGRRRAAVPTARTEAEASRAEPQAPAPVGASLPESEATLPRQPAAKATAKKATATKATAKKATATKAASKATASKATATAKKAPAAVKKVAATAPAPKATASKVTAKKVPAKKATTKATAPRKAAVKTAATAAPARKASPAKTTAKKTATKRTAAKATPAKAVAKTTTAKKSTVKKATAKKTAAKAVPAKKATKAISSTATRVTKRA